MHPKKKKDPKDLAGVHEEQEFLANELDTNPTEEMGGEVWHL